jgi:hypothetical protein
MKIITLFLALLLAPLPASAAVTHNSSQGSSLESGATSHSFSFTNTSGNYMLVVVQNRLTVGGCSTSDIDDLAVTYNGVALTFLKGSATDGVAGGSGTCVFGHLLGLSSPATGANTLSLTWTGTARVSVAVKTFAGVGSLGTILESNSTGNFTLSPTVTATDMVAGALALADNVTAFAMNQSNQVETSDSGGNVGAGMNTNTGSGAVTVSGTYGAFRRIWWAVPLLEAGGAVESPPPQDAIFFE